MSMNSGGIGPWPAGASQGPTYDRQARHDGQGSDQGSASSLAKVIGKLDLIEPLDQFDGDGDSVTIHIRPDSKGPPVADAGVDVPQAPPVDAKGERSLEEQRSAIYDASLELAQASIEGASAATRDSAEYASRASLCGRLSVALSEHGNCVDPGIWRAGLGGIVVGGVVGGTVGALVAPTLGLAVVGSTVGSIGGGVVGAAAYRGLICAARGLAGCAQESYVSRAQRSADEANAGIDAARGHLKVADSLESLAAGERSVAGAEGRPERPQDELV